ncbi:MAG TPA: methyltransferase domain-containing protein [Allosphingosinicella sp.]|nr:methyltransferase domain-containing protein [Allosphingosinicella sp.]
MSQDTPFDRRLRRLRRDRAANADAEGRYLLRLAADELVERLDLVKREFRNALVLGSGDLYLSHRLEALGLEVVSADAGSLSGRAGSVQCDEDRLPFADRSFDLVASVGVLDSVNDLPGALTLIRRILRPDGLFMAAIAGAGSLPRLRSAMLAADGHDGGAASPRIHPQIDIRAAGDLLGRAGFALPVVDSDAVTIRFSSLMTLVSDVRACAATNILASRSTVPLGKAALAAAIADFHTTADADGKTAETFQILYLLGWAPSPDQPQPARRGSGAQSLAAALATKPKN